MVNCCVCSCSCGRLAAVPVAGFSSQSYLNIVKQYCFLVFFFNPFSQFFLFGTLCLQMNASCISLYVVLKCNLFIVFACKMISCSFVRFLLNSLCLFGKSAVFLFLF